MARSKADRKKQEIQLAEVWPDSPIETEGAVGPTISAKTYRKELAGLQVELVKLQEWVKATGLKIVILFRGTRRRRQGRRDQTLMLSLKPASRPCCRSGRPTERERTQWYFQRYAATCCGRRDGLL